MVRIFEDIDREIAAGRLWRAKEMLQGALSGPTFDAALLERYGQLLLAMHDTLDAGRYLFASGRRSPIYDDAIALFLSRHPPDGGHVMDALPAMVRRRADVLADTISSNSSLEAGYPQEMLDELAAGGPRKHAESESGPRLLKAFPAMVVLCLLLVAACLLVGAVTIASWLWDSATGWYRHG